MIFLIDTNCDIVKEMELSERIAELEALKSSGQISQQEFDVLVSLAQTQNAKSVEQPPVLLEESGSENTQTESERASSIFSPKKGLIVFAAIVLLAFAFKSTQQSDPKESKEYKQLLKRKTELLATKTERLLTKTDLEGKIGDVDELQTDVNMYIDGVERWKQRISDVNSLGITG